MTEGRAPGRFGSRRGAALVSALGVALVLAVLAAATARIAAVAGFEARRERAQLHADAALESAMILALARISERDPEAAPVRYGEAFSVETPHGRIEAVLASPAGRLDLNAASPAALAAVLAAAGAPHERTAALTAAILERRSGASLTEAMRGPFASVDELQDLPGMDAALHACLQGVLTVASGARTPDLRLAPPWLHAALTGAAPPAADPLPAAAAAGSLYEITLRETHDGRLRYRAWALARLTGDPADPVWLHAWRLEADGDAGEPCPPPAGLRYEAAP